MENKEIFDNNEFTAKTENTQPEAVQGATSPVQSQDYENIYSSAQTTTEAPAAAESVQSNSSEQTSDAAGVQQQPHVISSGSVEFIYQFFGTIRVVESLHRPRFLAPVIHRTPLPCRRQKFCAAEGNPVNPVPGP